MASETESRKSNTLLHDALILCAITLIAGLLVSFFYELTKNPIAENELKTKNEAYENIFADASYDSDITLPGGLSAEETGEAALLAADADYGNVSVDEITEVSDSAGSFIGYILTVTTGDGFGGDIEITVGVDDGGIVTGVEILSIDETAGLGMQAREESFRDQYVGKDTTGYTVTKSDAETDDEIEALSGATITSRAMTNAVNTALTTALYIMEN